MTDDMKVNVTLNILPPGQIRTSPLGLRPFVLLEFSPVNEEETDLRYALGGGIATTEEEVIDTLETVASLIRSTVNGLDDGSVASPEQ